MKRQIIIGSLLAATLIGGSFGAWGANATTARQGKGMKDGRGDWKEMSPEKRLARMARELGLSDAQQAQIKAVFAAEREKNGPLMEKMKEYRKQLNDAAKATPFDEAAVRDIATNKGQVGIELSVSHARVQSQVHAILTPEQQAKLEKLHPPRKPKEGRPLQPDGEEPLP